MGGYYGQAKTFAREAAQEQATNFLFEASQTEHKADSGYRFQTTGQIGGEMTMKLIRLWLTIIWMTSGLFFQ